MMERRKYDEGDNERDEDVHRLDFMIELYLVFDTRVFVRALWPILVCAERIESIEPGTAYTGRLRLIAWLPKKVLTVPFYLTSSDE